MCNIIKILYIIYLSFQADAIGAGDLGLNSRAGQIGTVSPTARHRCEVSSELYYPGAKPRKLPRYSLHASG